MAQYDEATVWMDRVITEFPASPEAPDALWQNGIYQIAASHPDEAIKSLTKLQQRYSAHFWAKYAVEKIQELEK